jgi:hypothetical protein
MVSLQMADYLGNGAYSGGRGRPNAAWLECARQEWKTRGTRCVDLRKAKRAVQGLTPAEAMAVARAAKSQRGRSYRSRFMGPLQQGAYRRRARVAKPVKAGSLADIKQQAKAMGIRLTHVLPDGRRKSYTKAQLFNMLAGV